jgi:hypothetical protein
LVVVVVIKRANRVGEDISIQVQYLIQLSNYRTISMVFLAFMDPKSVVVSSIAMILITNQFKCHTIGEEESMCLTWLDIQSATATVICK